MLINKKFRFPYADSDNRCHDCGVLPGEIHHENCDVEKCFWTGRQKLGCDCGKCSKQLAWNKRVPFGFESNPLSK